jgi:hypothetical protein
MSSTTGTSGILHPRNAEGGKLTFCANKTHNGRPVTLKPVIHKNKAFALQLGELRNEILFGFVQNNFPSLGKSKYQGGNVSKQNAKRRLFEFQMYITLSDMHTLFIY